MLLRLSIDHPPVLQQRLPRALLPGITVISVSCIIRDFFSGSPVGWGEWLIPSGKGVIVRSKRAWMPREVKLRKADLGRKAQTCVWSMGKKLVV